MSECDVSVIVPVYQAERTLMRCVRSILSQTHSNFECLLVDDGSTDGSGGICDRLAASDSRIRVIHKANGGLSSARNAGLDMMTGEFVVFVDSDDYVDERYLEYLLRLIRSLPNCRLAISGINCVRNGHVQAFRTCPDGVLSARDVFEHVLYDERISPSACAKAYGREVFSRLRYRDGAFFEDEDLIGEVLQGVGNVAVGSECHYYYVQNAASIVHQPFSLKKFNDQKNATEHMCSLALEMDASLLHGVRRRRVRNCMSLLRLMGNGVADRYPEQFAFLRKEVLRLAVPVLRDRKTGLREKFGIISLCLGGWAFFGAWRAYEIARSQRGCKVEKEG